MDEYDSVFRQQEIARRLWEEQTCGPTEPDPTVTDPEAELLWRCRDALGLSPCEAADGPLSGIVSARRLRRAEVGEEDIPPRAWHVYARLLWRAQLDDLVEQIVEVCPEVEAEIGVVPNG